MRLRKLMLMLLVVYIIANVVIYFQDEKVTIEADFRDVFIRHGIPDSVGIIFYSSDGIVYYKIIDGKISKLISEKLPDPTSLSHRQPDIWWDGYEFLPKRVGIKYVGPQLISPDREVTVASFIENSGKSRLADRFIVFQNNANKVVHEEILSSNRRLMGIAWSTGSDFFVLLTLKTRKKINWDIMSILSSMSGHPNFFSDYYLSWYSSKGVHLVSDKIVTINDGSYIKIVWN